MNTKTELNSDTQRIINQIINRGYYERHTILGVGGWPTLYKSIGDAWKSYTMIAQGGDGEQFDDSITARDDKSAKSYFETTYHLDKLLFYSIHEVITRNRTIAASKLNL